MEEKIKKLIEELKEPYDGFCDDEGYYASGYDLAMEIVVDRLIEILEE